MQESPGSECYWLRIRGSRIPPPFLTEAAPRSTPVDCIGCYVCDSSADIFPTGAAALHRGRYQTPR